MVEHIFFDPDLEWLDHVQPVGLVIAPNLIKELGLIPERQTQAETAEVAEIIETDVKKSALADPWAFVSRILGWDARYVAGVPGGPPLPDTLSVRLPEHETTLCPTWAVRELSGSAANNSLAWQLLVRVESETVDLDERGALGGWEATAHQRFERLLRETGVFAGVLVSSKELRLVYAPRGETSGWLSFPLRDLAGVSGRPMLAGLKLILGSYRLFNDADDRRLPALLKRSRDAQAAVSTKLAEQVLGALHELLRALDRAEPDLIRELSSDRPGHLYEGLLAVLMRLVFILYAEDRDIIPSRTDTQARALYDENYSVRGLFAKLVEDAALNPDTMDERLGAWGRLIALFRLVHKGDASGWIKGRGGKLFDPDAFPFLEGRTKMEDAPRVIKLPDGFVLRILEGLMTIENRRAAGQQKIARERLSYRTLDVEQIGSVYETVMGFTVEVAPGSMLAIKAGKKNNVPVFVGLDALAEQKGEARLKHLKEETGRDKFGARAETAIKTAKTAAELSVAFAGVVDSRGSPNEAAVVAGTPILQPTDERRRTGSHYTPRSLTEPIVRHALEPAFERLGPDAKPEEILDLKICDPAMGSGAFLVEACRALSVRLTEAWTRWPNTRPKIPADEDEELHARRLVAQRCLYGVDKNPMATDLARLSLWLATLARDHEFTFLDHALKTGDSIVGLTSSQIAAAIWDDSKPSLPLFRQLVMNRVREALKARAEIQGAPDDTTRLIQESRHRAVEGRLAPIRLMGDAVISAFFAGNKPKEREKKRAEVESYLSGSLEGQGNKLEAAALSLRLGNHPIMPFHWHIEFPEVFVRENAGFDAIVANPPFLSGSRTSNIYGSSYFQFLLNRFPETKHQCDLVTFFVRKSFDLLRSGGACGIISTNTLSQGDTRESSLRWILNNSGKIYRVKKRLRWPGEAAVVISIVHFGKSVEVASTYDDSLVERISAYLVPGFYDSSPCSLALNPFFSKGSQIYGQGFVFDDQDSKANPVSRLDIIRRSDDELRHVFEMFGGIDINTQPQLHPGRWVINVSDISDEKSLKSFPEIYKVLLDKVKPGRDKLPDNANNKPLKRRWWAYQAPRPELYRRLSGRQYCLAHAEISPHLAFRRVRTGPIFIKTVILIDLDAYYGFAVLQSRIHEVWARFFASSLKDDLRYTASDCFATFPFPSNLETLSELEAAGQAYHDHRAELMISRNEGLTKTYNCFHSRSGTSSDIVRLRELHTAMDTAVLLAYGWPDLLKRAKAEYLDETNEGDHKYQGRYFWPTPLRDEVLARLLELNAQRAEAERRDGLTPVEVEEVDADEGEDV